LTLITKIRKIAAVPNRVEVAVRGLADETASVDEWTEANSRLARATPREILEWAVDRFGSRLTMATAFGAEGCVLLHLLSEINAPVRVFNLNTGYQFPETLELREQIAARYGIQVEMVSADTTVAEYEKAHGGPLYVTNHEQCCYDRKIVPLRRALSGYGAWITAIRADQSSERASARIVGPDPKFGLIKINPLLSWRRRDVWAFIATHHVLYNPLHDRGYASIGCWPCTRALETGESERAGRWAGHAKTECGLHSLDSSQL
jgi:phosphoadenosine phosphosulfate reductase